MSMIQPTVKNIRYFLYARKSSESEDRQVQSIDDQINRLQELARDLNLNVREVYTESKSAKMPNNRPKFTEMMERIQKGEADGILCWQLNRLTRNPVDSGTLSWLLQQGIIKIIQTIDRPYLPDDNVLLFNVETGMANQYILDLRKNCMRGLLSKLQKGWLPNYAPLGYLNDKEEKTIIEDPERFNIIRKMWDLMLTGNYTPPKILELVNNAWGLRTRKSKHSGGKELSRAGIYRIFTNLFYTGIIEWDGKQHEGKHKPMITLEEYDRVQTLLGRKGKPRPQTHSFAYTGFIRCGECGCLYTAETKKKLIKGTGETREYTYYHCTRKKKTGCSQRKVMRVEELEQQIEQELQKYTILPEFLDWALECINQKNDAEIEDRRKIHKMRSNSLLATQNELDELTRMRYRQLIDDDTYMRERNTLQAKITRLKAQLRETESRAEKWLELTEKTFQFATYARKAFITGDLQTKKEILAALGQNATIKDRKLSIQANAWLQPIADTYPALQEEYLRLEPSQIAANKTQTEAMAAVRLQWRRGWDSNPRSRLPRIPAFEAGPL